MYLNNICSFQVVLLIYHVIYVSGKLNEIKSFFVIERLKEGAQLGNSTNRNEWNNYHQTF